MIQPIPVGTAGLWEETAPFSEVLAFHPSRLEIHRTRLNLLTLLKHKRERLERFSETVACHYKDTKILAINLKRDHVNTLH